MQSQIRHGPQGIPPFCRYQHIYSHPLSASAKLSYYSHRKSVNRNSYPASRPACIAYKKKSCHSPTEGSSWSRTKTVTLYVRHPHTKQKPVRHPFVLLTKLTIASFPAFVNGYCANQRITFKFYWIFYKKLQHVRLRQTCVLVYIFSCLGHNKGCLKIAFRQIRSSLCGRKG